MFDAAEISQGEIKLYRSFMFLPALGDCGHDPFSSVENATTWITSCGYQLHLEHDDAQMSLSLWNPDQATPSQVRAYCSFMIGDAYMDHSFFSMDNTDSWISLVPFHTYMNIFHGSFDEYRTRNSTPFSQARSSVGSRALSRANSSFSRGESRPSSRASFLLALCAPSSRSSSPFGNNVIEISSDSDDDLSAALPAPPLVPKIEDTTSALQIHQTAVSFNTRARQCKGKEKADEGKIQITCQDHMDELSREIPSPVISRLKTIMGLSTQQEIDDWHTFCAAQPYLDVKNWYAHKLANPWIFPSINKFLSNIPDDSWVITPNHSNIVETMHAGCNAETAIRVGLLTAILQAQTRNNAKAADLIQIENEGMMRKRWNGVGERKKLLTQRKVWRMRKASI
ncbi:hypothetical protein K438DRAFT_1982394 [Mycena galopus ATCC 62051]|nr:hypothetical protein K438DRAFT_1982394 [Mycena galopus ATCC 62051]